MNILNHYQNITLTTDQQSAVEQLQKFLESDGSVFILQGYAGNGEITVLGDFESRENLINKNDTNKLG